MQIGMIGLGRMGANMVMRLCDSGHKCVAYARDLSHVPPELQNSEAFVTDSMESFIAELAPPRAVWIMVPNPVVDSVIEQITPHLEAGDVIIDGGNTYFPEDMRRAVALQESGIEYLDVGTSGGVWGRERGYCLMIGGNAAAVDLLDPVFRTLSPDQSSAPATPGRSAASGTADLGYLHCGGHGAGHFVKMIHNGIEYGMMAAFAEGFAILNKAGDEGVDLGAAMPAMALDTDPGEIAELWRRGSVVGSWLLDLAASSMHQDPTLEEFSGHVSDSGEGRWTVKTATDMGVPAHVLTAALYSRFASRGEADYSNKVLSALRFAFGGHVEES